MTPILFTGCLKEDLSDCKDVDNVFLMFDLKASGQSGIFTDIITSVDVILFDKNGKYVMQKRVNEDDLKTYQGVRFYVKPGLYRAVAWANVSEASSLSTQSSSGYTRFAESYLQTVSDQSGDNLYYAPDKETGPVLPDDPDLTIYEVNVGVGEETHKQLSFIRANRRLSIYIRNFKGIAKPTIQLSSIPDRYDYYLRTYETRKDYSRTTGTVKYNVTDELMEFADFRAPIADFDASMVVKLIDNDTNAVIKKTVNIKKFVEDNVHLITDMNELSMVLTINLDASISIALPDWKNNDVKPIW